MDIASIDNYVKTSWLWWLFGSSELPYEIQLYKENIENNHQSSDIGRTICSRIEYKIRNKPYSFSDWMLKNIYKSFTENELYQKYLLIPEELRLYQNRSQSQNFKALQLEYEYFYKKLQGTTSMEEARKLAQQMYMLHQYRYRLSSDLWSNGVFYRSVLLLPTQDCPLTFDAGKGYIDLKNSHFDDKKLAEDRLEEQFSKIIDIIKSEKNTGKLRIILPTSERVHIQAPHNVYYDLPKDYFILMQNRLVEALVYRKKHVAKNNDIIVVGGIVSPSLDTLHAIVQEPNDTSAAIAGYLALKKIPSVSLKQGSMFVNKRNNNPILPVELINYIICSYLAPPVSGNSLIHAFLILFPIPKKYLRKNENQEALKITSVESQQEITLVC